MTLPPSSNITLYDTISYKINPSHIPSNLTDMVYHILALPVYNHYTIINMLCYKL
jgi:hypothetical protein